MFNLLEMWRAWQADRVGKATARAWRAGYDFAAGHLLRDGMPESVLRLIDATPSYFDAGIRCAVRDYRAALLRETKSHLKAVH